MTWTVPEAGTLNHKSEVNYLLCNHLNIHNLEVLITLNINGINSHAVNLFQTNQSLYFEYESTIKRTNIDTRIQNHVYAHSDRESNLQTLTQKV